MDPNLLNFFASTPNPNNALAARQQAANAAALWAAAGFGVDSTLSPDFTTGVTAPSLQSFAQPPTTQASLPMAPLAGPSPYAQASNALAAGIVPSGSGSTQRKREGHERKRTKINSDAAALESVDYWIQFDDDDNDRGGSFEIDFSKQRANSNPKSFSRNASSFNTMSTTPGLGTGLYSSQNTLGLRREDFVDDSALDNALSDDDDGLDSINISDHLSKIDSAPPPEVPPREGLYSTPLSWERPQPGLQIDPLFNIGATSVMSDAEQQKLLAIAMNSGRPASGFGTGFSFGYGAGGFGDPFGLGGLGAPNPMLDARLMGTPNISQFIKPDESVARQTATATEKKASSEKEAKGKQPASGSSSASPAAPAPASSSVPASASGTAAPTPSQQPQLQSSSSTSGIDKGKEKMKLGGDRTAHNDIERKYRTNLKDRISELRDAVPALKSMPDEGDDGDEGSQSQRGPKVSKGTVLTKATEYIHYLERRNKSIMNEHQELSRRLQAFEQLLNATARQPFPMPNYSRTLFDPRGFC